MTGIYVLEHVVRYDGSSIIDVYDSWDALVYGVSQHYPAAPDGTTLTTEAAAALLTPDSTDDRDPRRWSTPGYGLSEEEWLRASKVTVKTATKALFEVRVRSVVLDEFYDRVMRTSDGIYNEAHAIALAEGWNTEPPHDMEPGAEFYVRQVI